MLDQGYRRGVQFGGDIARLQPGLTGDDSAIKVLAAYLFAWLDQHHYAYIAPVERFSVGFLDGFKVSRNLSSVSL